MIEVANSSFRKIEESCFHFERFEVWQVFALGIIVVPVLYFICRKTENTNSKFRERKIHVKKQEVLKPKRPSLLTEKSQRTKPIVATTDTCLMAQFDTMLKNTQVFGHLEQELFDDLRKNLEVKHLEKNHILVKPPDKDDSIYIVQSGRLIVYIESDKVKFPVKIVEEGDGVFSMLSVLDVLTNYPSDLKTVSVKADIPSVVFKLRTTSFREVFDKYPESWVRVVQNIALNLQHVTFDTLHSFLGLTQELLKPTLVQQAPIKKVTKSSAENNPKVSVLKSTPEDLSSTNTNKSEKVTPKFINRDKHLDVYTTKFAELLGLKEEKDPEMSILKNRISISSYPSDFILCEEGSLLCSLYYVIQGTVEMLQETIGEGNKAKTVVISKAYPNEIIGSLAILTGASFYSLRTNHQTRVAEIKKEDLYDIMTLEPRIVLNVAHFLIQRISPFVRQIDFALSWLMCDAGRILYKQMDKPDALYLVLSGRLRAVVTDDDGEKIVDEFGRSNVVGMVEVFTEQTRSSTVISVRSTELAKLPEGLLNFIKHKYPQILNRLVKLMSTSMVRQHEFKLSGAMESWAHVSNLNTIAVMAVSADVPLNCFTLELLHNLNTMKPTLRLSVEVVEQSLGSHALEKVNEYRLLSWLNLQEEAYGVVLYQCDTDVTDWTKRCIRQADCILIVANGYNSPTIGPIGREFENLDIRTRKELVLLWPVQTKCPYNTSDWLNIGPDISYHYHIRAHHHLFMQMSPEYLLQFYERKFAHGADKFSDFSRLSRMLTGTSVGLVLGGGGARGASHVGVIRALKEAGIPIDIVGGTSIGALIGGIYCGHPNWKSVQKKARDWFIKMSSFWSKLLDLTYPYSSLFSGDGFNQGIQEVFKETQIEDLWIPYFCITTDITASEMRVNQNGSLWRYCRGSMSLAGYLPPICSEDDGHLLLDGGYVNNLPADVMRNLGIATILAVDVGARDEEDLTNYGDSLSGWWLLWKKYWPFTDAVNVLNMAEIQSRLSYVSCSRQLEIVKRAPYCYFMRPPIDSYNTLDFGKFELIYKLGYDYGKETCDGWLKSGKLQDFFSSQVAVEDKVRTKSESFTDLAALVSAVDNHSWSISPNAKSFEFDLPMKPEPIDKK